MKKILLKSILLIACVAMSLFSSATCTVHFTDSITGTSVTFHGTSTGYAGPMYSWDFGDGNFGSGASTSHTYTTIGSGYMVCLTVTDTASSGCTTTTCDSLWPNPAGPCVAQFTTSITNSHVDFTNTSTGWNSSTTFSWSFGDASYSSQFSPTHTYLATGTYNVCLVMTNASLGCSDTFCTTVNITSIVACNANFTLIPDSITPHLYYGFNLAVGTGALTYLWAWGDGSTDNTAYPTHTYASPGVYNICLTVTDAASCTNTYCNSTNILRVASGPPVTIVIHNAVTGIHTPEMVNELSVYPNPASGSTMITYSASDVKIRLYDIMGNELQETVTNRQIKGENKTELNTSQLANGIYMLHIEADGRSVNKKLVVNH